jgi:excinuclease ABC subunit A
MIKIKNTSENNLKNISLNIPKNKITSVIGISGSGKSTLIYNVLANEAKRREKIDSANANCYDYAIRPKFESIENLPYCITLKQRGLQQSISSTLATITKLHELLREEFVKYGQIIGEIGNIINKPMLNDINEFINKYYSKENFKYFAVVAFNKQTDGIKELQILKNNNIDEAIFISSFDGKEKVKRVLTVKSLNDKFKHTISVAFNNIDTIENYENIAIDSFLAKSKDIDFNFGFEYPDLLTGKIYQKKSTQLLSFNATNKFSGKCEECNGHGIVEDIDLETLIIKDRNLDEHFLNLEDNGKGAYKYVNIRPNSIQKDLQKQKINLNQTFYDLSNKEQKSIKDEIYPKILKHQAKPSIGKFVKSIKCPVCNGSRLNYKANAIKLHGVNISEILSFTVDKLYDFLQDKELHHKKILTILHSLQKATLGYLTLDRTTDTLSGGELQRLKFAMELNSDYKDLLYILDEPSTGLHPYNNYQMISLIKNLRDKGNTVIVSEHNRDYINNSDYIVELGYGSGEAGGEIIFTGENKTFDDVAFTRVKLDIDLKNSMELLGVNANNIKNESFVIPLNCLVAISGISGSGKSSLIHKVLVPTIKQYLADKTFNSDLVKEIKNLDSIKAIVELTQSQIGINSRSIVATYLNIFDKIRDIFSSSQIAQEFGFDKSYFSFNSDIGRCETCKGLGKIEEIVCPNCLGQRYKAEVLDIRVKELNIFEILNTQIDKLSEIFEDEKLRFAFETLERLGLSHINLGRTTPTLSGGEAQRLKLAKTLIESFHKIKKGNFLFILDEPTTGLNAKDTAKIYSIFDEILSFHNSIIIIEHNQNIIKNSDFIIDIGIGSGKYGGKNLFAGSFEALLKHNTSLTAKAFNNDFENIENIQIDTSNLSKKIYNNLKEPNCHQFYLDDKHFAIEKDFAKNYKVITDDKNHKYFNSKEELFTFIESLEDIKISFNPFVTELFRYKKVPLSLKKEKIKHLKKLGFKIDLKDFEQDEWGYRIDSDTLQKAYNFGNAWITVKSGNITYELFTRLVSIKNKIIGTPKIDEKTFNLYLNTCIYCDGTFSKGIYNQELIIADKNKSILDNGFFHANIKFNLKGIITRFQKENLFDFTKTFNELSDEEQNIFLFGFKEYKFLKPKGRINAIGDYIRWQGIYKYIYDDLKKIKIADEIKKSKSSIKCPFCSNGFKKEVAFYKNKNITINSYLYLELSAK